MANMIANKGGNLIPETLNRNNTEVPKYGNDEWQQPGDYRQLHRDPAEIYISICRHCRATRIEIVIICLAGVPEGVEQFSIFLLCITDE